MRLTRDSLGYIISRDYLEGYLASIHIAKGGYIKHICGTISKDFLGYKIRLFKGLFKINSSCKRSYIRHTYETI